MEVMFNYQHDGCPQALAALSTFDSKHSSNRPIKYAPLLSETITRFEIGGFLGDHQSKIEEDLKLETTIFGMLSSVLMEWGKNPLVFLLMVIFLSTS